MGLNPVAPADAAYALDARLVVGQASTEGAQVVGVQLLVVDQFQLLKRHGCQRGHQLLDRAQTVTTRVLEIDQGVVEVEEDRFLTLHHLARPFTGAVRGSVEIEV